MCFQSSRASHNMPLLGFNKTPAAPAPAAAAPAPAAPRPRPRPRRRPAPAPAAARPRLAAQLTAFCAGATRTRPPPHGVQHMTKVRERREDL